MGEGVPQFAALDIVADVMDADVAQLRVAQSAHRVIFIEALLRLGRRFDMPFDQGRGEGAGNFMGEHCLSGTGLPLDEKRALQNDGGIDRHGEIVRRDIVLGAFKTHRNLLFSPRTVLAPAAGNCKGMVFAALSQYSGKWPEMGKIVPNQGDGRTGTCL